VTEDALYLAEISAAPEHAPGHGVAEGVGRGRLKLAGHLGELGRSLHAGFFLRSCSQLLSGALAKDGDAVAHQARTHPWHQRMPRLRAILGNQQLRMRPPFVELRVHSILMRKIRLLADPFTHTYPEAAMSSRSETFGRLLKGAINRAGGLRG
jgi:hypothetical protein